MLCSCNEASVERSPMAAATTPSWSRTTSLSRRSRSPGRSASFPPCDPPPQVPLEPPSDARTAPSAVEKARPCEARHRHDAASRRAASRRAPGPGRISTGRALACPRNLASATIRGRGLEIREGREKPPRESRRSHRRRHLLGAVEPVIELDPKRRSTPERAEDRIGQGRTVF